MTSLTWPSTRCRETSPSQIRSWLVRPVLNQLCKLKIFCFKAGYDSYDLVPGAGDPTLIRIKCFPEDNQFFVQFDNDEPTVFTLQTGVATLDHMRLVSFSGNATVNFAGFVRLGADQFLPIGAQLIYSCPTGMVFDHNWFLNPSITLKCLETGVFARPDKWPNCVHRKKFLQESICVYLY